MPRETCLWPQLTNRGACPLGRWLTLHPPTLHPSLWGGAHRCRSLWHTAASRTQPSLVLGCTQHGKLRCSQPLPVCFLSAQVPQAIFILMSGSRLQLARPFPVVLFFLPPISTPKDLFTAWPRLLTPSLLFQEALTRDLCHPSSASCLPLPQGVRRGGEEGWRAWGIPLPFRAMTWRLSSWAQCAGAQWQRGWLPGNHGVPWGQPCLPCSALSLLCLLSSRHTQIGPATPGW